jgi:hypothetical protein
MQPAFRKGDGVLLKDSYDDGGDGEVWLPLRKGGPNGFISVLTLLAWWGQSLSVDTQWEEQTDGMWKDTVLDITHCLRKMMDAGRKRAHGDDDGEQPPTKRYVHIFLTKHLLIIAIHVASGLCGRLQADTCALIW